MPSSWWGLHHSTRCALSGLWMVNTSNMKRVSNYLLVSYLCLHTLIHLCHRIQVIGRRVSREEDKAYGGRRVNGKHDNPFVVKTRGVRFETCCCRWASGWRRMCCLMSIEATSQDSEFLGRSGKFNIHCLTSPTMAGSDTTRGSASL